MSDTTTMDSAHSALSAELPAPSVATLVVVWSAEEPWRVGECLVPAAGPAGDLFLFGRGEPKDDDEHPRVMLRRMRAGRVDEAAQLADAHVSRAQLLLRSTSRGLEITNVGKRALLVDGRTVTEALVLPGQLVEIKRQLVFLCTRRTAAIAALREPHASLIPAFGEADDYGTVGESLAAWALRDEIAFVAKRDEHVLLRGGSGAGKELAAIAIHALSARRDHRMVSRNAATFPSGLVDAELFGSAANYPNAGMPERPGLIGEADRSTLFLDEIGELPVGLDAHLLRVLDEAGDYQRLGESRRRTADIRLIAATNRPLERLKFDLVARFSIRVMLPSLNDRREDVPLMAHHFLRVIADEDDTVAQRFFSQPAKTGGARRQPRVTKELMSALVTHAYATDARELRALLWRAITTSTGDAIELTDGVREMLGAPSSSEEKSPSAPPKITREILVAALASHDGKREEVWRELGLTSRHVLKRLLKKFGINDAGEPGSPPVDD
jgi:two-component system nitrogen regulation response regulator GlnG/two-component system response regulator HydG